MKEFKSEKAIVRIHEGNLTPEKRKKVLEQAMIQLWKTEGVSNEFRRTETA